jgi:hypothetical protein
VHAPFFFAPLTIAPQFPGLFMTDQYRGKKSRMISFQLRLRNRKFSQA